MSYEGKYAYIVDNRRKEIAIHVIDRETKKLFKTHPVWMDRIENSHLRKEDFDKDIAFISYHTLDPKEAYEVLQKRIKKERQNLDAKESKATEFYKNYVKGEQK